MRPQDIDKLIACVLQKPPIWDKRDKNHCCRILVDRCWKDIAADIGLDEALLRKKWKYLREQFCVELGKITPPGSGDDGSNPETTKWPHFKALLFLKNVVRPRQTSTTSISSNLVITVPVDPANFAEDSADYHQEESQHSFGPFDQGIDQDHLSAPSPSQLSQFQYASVTEFRKRRSPSENEPCFDIENKRPFLVNTMEESQQPEDEDMMFFRSLLPHTRKVHPAEKLPMRSQIMEVVSRYAYPEVHFNGRTFKSEDVGLHQTRTRQTPRFDSD